MLVMQLCQKTSLYIFFLEKNLNYFLIFRHENLHVIKMKGSKKFVYDKITYHLQETFKKLKTLGYQNCWENLKNISRVNSPKKCCQRNCASAEQQLLLKPRFPEKCCWCFPQNCEQCESSDCLLGFFPMLQKNKVFFLSLFLLKETVSKPEQPMFRYFLTSQVESLEPKKVLMYNGMTASSSSIHRMEISDSSTRWQDFCYFLTSQAETLERDLYMRKHGLEEPDLDFHHKNFHTVTMADLH